MLYRLDHPSLIGVVFEKSCPPLPAMIIRPFFSLNKPTLTTLLETEIEDPVVVPPKKKKKTSVTKNSEYIQTDLFTLPLDSAPVTNF
jgi:hypothetical protein